jgi:hypothetical protein
VNNIRKIAVANLVLAILFFTYLCVLDLVFVLVLDQEQSILNDFVLFIFAMPFISVFLVFKLSEKNQPIKRLLINSISFFCVSSIIAYMMLLWIMTHFHTMIGGNI